jgi:hypothetical protein
MFVSLRHRNGKIPSWAVQEFFVELDLVDSCSLTGIYDDPAIGALANPGYLIRAFVKPIS